MTTRVSDHNRALLSISQEKIADGRGDLRGVRLQRKMPRIEEADDRVRDIAFEGLGACRKEKRVVLPPYRQKGRPMGAEIPLEGRIQCDVALVVAEQVELHLIGARPGEVEIVERVPVRRYYGWIGNAVGILPDRRLGLEEGAKRLAVGRRSVLPIGPDRVPAVAQPLLIGVAILRDDRRDPLGML